MNTKLNPLDIAIALAKDVELEVTYEYEDLVFIKHNPFLLRFDQEDASKIHLHFNEDCEEDALTKLQKVLSLSAKAREITLVNDTKYAMTEDIENNDLKIKFLPA